MNLINTIHNMAGQPNELYGSHLPILTKMMEMTHGPVLELGMGLYSTPLLHTLCELQNRPLSSFDNDPEWFSENKKWESKHHSVYLLKEWNELYAEYQYVLNQVHWSVAFIDHKPAKRRKEECKRLAHNTNFLIIHDSEPESDKFFKYSWIYDLYKYRYDYTKLRPHTTVLSNFIDLSFL